MHCVEGVGIMFVHMFQSQNGIFIKFGRFFLIVLWTMWGHPWLTFTWTRILSDVPYTDLPWKKWYVLLNINLCKINNCSLKFFYMRHIFYFPPTWSMVTCYRPARHNSFEIVRRPVYFEWVRHREHQLRNNTFVKAVHRESRSVSVSYVKPHGTCSEGMCIPRCSRPYSVLHEPTCSETRTPFHALYEEWLHCDDRGVGVPTPQLHVITFHLHNLRLHAKIAMFIYKFSDASVGLASFFEILSWFCYQKWAPQ